MAHKMRDANDLEESHDINVTPFIDVMLVLLIIFMVAAPISTVDVPVDLPGSTATATPLPPQPVYLTVQQDLALTLAEVPVTRENLATALGALTGADRAPPVYLRADRAVAYGDLMAVMNLLRAAGYLKVALVGLDGLPAADRAAP